MYAAETQSDVPNGECSACLYGAFNSGCCIARDPCSLLADFSADFWLS